MGIDGGFNLYAYANVNPLFFVDPFGLQSGQQSCIYGCHPAPVFLSLPERQEPGISDQFNVFGLRGRTGTENYTGWFEQRFPQTVTGSQQLLSVRIEKMARANAGKQPTSLPDFIDGANDVDIKDNMIRFGDVPQNWWERNIQIGSFEIKADNIQLHWSDKYNFSYSANVFVQEHTGADAPWAPGGECIGEDPLWFTGAFVNRDVRMAEWTISGNASVPHKGEQYDFLRPHNVENQYDVLRSNLWK
jgi:hypothetical protein